MISPVYARVPFVSAGRFQNVFRCRYLVTNRINLYQFSSSIQYICVCVCVCVLARSRVAQDCCSIRRQSSTNCLTFSVIYICIFASSHSFRTNRDGVYNLLSVTSPTGFKLWETLKRRRSTGSIGKTVRIIIRLRKPYTEDGYICAVKYRRRDEASFLSISGARAVRLSYLGKSVFRRLCSVFDPFVRAHPFGYGLIKV